MVHQAQGVPDVPPEIEILSILVAARVLIAHPHRWTRRHFARTREGTTCHPCSTEAYRFCLEGALWHTCQDTDWHGSDEFLKTVHGVESLTGFNDKSSHDQILAALDWAIDLLMTGGRVSADEPFGHLEAGMAV